LLRRNASQNGSGIAIVEINPRSESDASVSWSEYETTESYPGSARRREVTWKFLDEQSDRVANFLLNHGLNRGSKIALLMMNSLEWFPIYFGVLRSGAMVVPINFRNTKDETRSCVELTHADALFFGPEFLNDITSLADGLPSVGTFVFVGPDCPDFAESYFSRVGRESADDPEIAISDEDDAAIYFTSGTTGQPKAILQTHSNLLSVCATEQSHHGQTEDDIFLCLAPLFHTGSMMHWFGSLASCGEAVLLRDAKPESILRAISDEGVTIAFMLVPWVQDILQAQENGGIDFAAYRLTQWRLMHIGAQPVPAELIMRWRRYFPNQAYDTNYGLSEAMGPGCVHLGIENTHKIGAIGKPGIGWQAIIVDESGKQVAQGTIGELIVKGPGVMKCYYNDEEATAVSLRGGWLFTGDMGYVDDDGFIFLVDRKKDLVISGGENIYPIQIEDHIRFLDAVKDVAVIGAYDKRLVEIPIAIVSLKDGRECGTDELIAHCEALPRYKRPRRFIFGDVPRSATGKIEKPKLRARYGGGPAA
jgi:acyl-CoA synthetase (AMP-forming)/AMP-acid ligase II